MDTPVKQIGRLDDGTEFTWSQDSDPEPSWMPAWRLQELGKILVTAAQRRAAVTERKVS